MAYGIWAGDARTVSEPVHNSRQGFTDRATRSSALKHAGNDTARIDDLLTRMRSGDREAAAAFITRYGSRLRRRIRGKLGPAMRRLFDSQEILSTVSRRLDMYVRKGRIQASHESQLWSLIFKIADHAMVDKIRVFEHLKSIEGSDGTFARDMLARLEKAEQHHQSSGTGAEIEIDQAMRALSDPIDRTILSMWLTGHPHSEIAQTLDMASTGVRKRWQNIKDKLRSRFATDLDGHDESC